ncbi:MAG: sugar ABC transporter permease [Geminicoccaceae bacterium]|nr:sugar ABC transporter permease [Geminicoccaceae bacterium]MCB9945656.1 sugar ABC transporter permease [Geminicoccaceae bacterium]
MADVKAAGPSTNGTVEHADVSRLTLLLNDRRVLAYLFLAPALIILSFTVVYPFLSAIWLSFNDKMAGAPATFVGLANYRELFGDAKFSQVIYNTFVYTIFAVAIKFVIGLAMAMVLAYDRPLNFIYKTILFIPWAVPSVVASLNWRWIYDDFSGMLNHILFSLGLISDVISWTGDRHYAMGSIVAVVVWSGTPFYTMSFLAGLKAIPKELYEAARIDGANRMQEFWNITVPSMRPVFTVVVMLSTIWTSTNVVFVLLLTNGGPANATQILPNLAYKYALLASRLGIGSAVNMVFFPILAILIIFLSRRMLQDRFK